MNKKVILSHPTANANVRAISEALAKANLLHKFFTSVAIIKGSRVYNFLNFGLLKEFRKRSFDPVLEPFIKSRPYRELGRMLSPIIGKKEWVDTEKARFSVDAVYQDLDWYVSRNLNNANAVYAYEDGALESFKRAKSQNLVCLYDLPIGYWRAMRKMLELERKQRPEWAVTLTGFSDSEAKLNRKDKELEFANAIFVASSFTKKTLEYYPGKLENIQVIPYGFPPIFEEREYENTQNRKLKLLFVGGLSQRKGIANILETVEELSEEVELTIVGKKLVENCNPLNKALQKHHWIPALEHEEILKLMRTQDILMFPSLFEGYGLVITEAMSQGTPVITTDRTCGADFIKHAENGWMVEAGNTQELINVMKEIIAKPSTIKQVGQNALATARKMPMEKYGNKMVQAISKELSKQ